MISPIRSLENSFNPDNSYERGQLFSNLSQSNLLIDQSKCSLIFEHTADSRSNVSYENYPFEEVLEVLVSEIQIGLEFLQAALVPSDFSVHCFNIKFATKGLKLVACGSSEDRN